MSKSRQNSYISDLKKLTYSCRYASKSFWTSDMTSKNDILMSILTQRNPADLPASDWFYSYYRPPKRGKSPAMPWSPVRCGASQHSNQLLVPGHVECRGRRVLSWVGLLLFLSVIMLPNSSGQIPETTALYYTPAKYRERWVYTLRQRGQNWTDPSSRRTSRTPVELGLRHTIEK